MNWKAAAGAALLAAAPAVWGACKIGQLEMPVRIVNHRPVGTLTLNGTEVPMLIDSGAFFSMLPLSTATQLGLRVTPLPHHIRIQGYTGAIDAQLTKVERVGLRGQEIRDVEFVVGGNELGSGIMGVLGRNFLSMADTEYDLAHGVVRLTFPKGECEKTNLAYWAGDAPVIEADLENSHREGNTDVRVTVRVNGVKATAIMDTGAPFTSLKLRTARRAGIKESDLKPVGRVGGAGQGRVRSWRGVVDSFEFGGEKISNNELRIDEADHFPQDMLIGLDYFLSHRIYVSRLQGKVYATWNGGPVFARGAAAGDDDARYAARPADVAPDDAEALARRGEAFAARGDWARALADLDRACELAPQAEANFLARARVHLAQRNSGKARQDLDTALRLRPELHEALALRANLRAATGDREGAQADLQTLDTTLPPAAHLREAMASVYNRLQLVPEALRQWELWVPTHRSDARLAHVLNERCWLRTRLNVDLKLALDDCKSAVSRDGGEAAYRDSLGWTHLRLNDASAALKAFNAAIEIRPRAFSLYGRALAQQRLGDGPAAERDLAEARKLQPGIDEAVRKAGFSPAEMPAPAASAAS